MYLRVLFVWSKSDIRNIRVCWHVSTVPIVTLALFLTETLALPLAVTTVESCALKIIFLPEALVFVNFQKVVCKL